ncbi:hypothetical protein [Bacillus solitudinis]|nr:hypothetical protein [Bacillus solitudinis]
MDSNFGWHAGGSRGTGLIVRLRRNGRLVARGRDKSRLSGADELI